MSSLDLLDVLNKYREEAGKPIMRHSHFMVKIRDEIGDEASAKFSATVIRELPVGGKREYPCYNLPRDECLRVSMRESKEVRSKMIDYIKELESAVDALTKPYTKIDENIDIVNDCIGQLQDLVCKADKATKIIGTEWSRVGHEQRKARTEFGSAVFDFADCYKTRVQ